MWLTFATFVGYAVDLHRGAQAADAAEHRHRRRLGRHAAGAGLGRDAGEVGPEALMLCLIIFLWTPPHFWALALYRAEDYRKAGLPMLPVTHGPEFTRLQVLLYTLVLFAATLLPFVYGMSGWIYLVAALLLGRGLHRAMPGSSGATTATCWRADLPLLHLAPVAAVRRAAAGPLPEPMAVCHDERPLHSSRCWPCAGRPRLAGLQRSAAAGFQGHRHHRRRIRAANSRCPTPTASRARWPTSRAR